jgi:fructose-1,6-bisphosphatase I
VLTDSDIKIKPRGKIYSINEGYYKYFDQETKDYVESVKNPKVNIEPLPGLLERTV